MFNILAAIVFTLTPSVCMAPCDVTAKVTIEQHEANNRVEMLLECDNYERRSEAPTPPTHPKTFLVRFPRIPAGECVLVMRLVRHDAGDWEAGRHEKSFVVSGNNNLLKKEKQ